MPPGIAKLMLDSLSVACTTATASSIARGRLGYMAGIAGLTGCVGIVLSPALLSTAVLPTSAWPPIKVQLSASRT